MTQNRFHDLDKTRQNKRRQIAPKPKNEQASPIQHTAVTPNSFHPTELPQLQRTIGNQAVTRLIHGSGSAVSVSRTQSLIQRRKFKDEGEVLSWVDEVFDSVKTAHPKQILDLKTDTFFQHLLREVKNHPAYGEGNDIGGNTGALWQHRDLILARIENKITSGTFEGFNKKRTLSESQKEHIFLGQLSEDGKRVTGYHWSGDPGAIAEGYGAKTDYAHGCYSQAVRLRDDHAVTKPKESTFFPDNWERKDIIVAIEYANSVGGNIFEVASPKKGAGLRLFYNGDSYFPFFD